jgi:hypothetical protein
MDFTVAVTTAPREVDYLAATLAHVRWGTSIVSLPHRVRVCVSGDPSQARDLATRHQDAGDVDFEPAIGEIWAIVRDAGPHRRCCANTWQALARAPAGRDVLLFQDDVELTEAWPLHLRYRLRLARERYGDRFILALYAAYPFRGEHLAPYPSEAFYGNQAVYFPAAVAEEYAARLLDHVHDWSLADDMVLKAYASEAGVPVLAALPNLAQHVGDVTTGLGSFHASPTYRRAL